MSIVTIPTAFNIDLEFNIAPFHKRLFAWVIDFVVLITFFYLMSSYAIPAIGGSYYAQVTAYIVLVYLPYVLYHLVFEVTTGGRSLGKMALGIKVVDISGKQPSFSQYLLRWMLRIIDMMVTLCLGAILSAALTKYTQRLGDLAAGTIVIDTKGKTGLHETIYLDIEEDKSYKPMYPQVMKLTDRDINGIRNLLNNKSRTKEAYNYMIEIATRIKTVLSISSDLETEAFLNQLLKDYNYLTRQ